MWFARIYSAEHELLADVALRNPTPEESRTTPVGIPHSARFTEPVAIPVDGYLVLHRDDLVDGLR
jgi:hypothetical protein